MKLKKYCLITAFLCAAVMLSSCEKPENSSDIENDKISVVTTIFPPFDFAREISKGRVNVTMLLKPGTESHSYEPSPTDIIAISSADLFIYTGGESDTWVDEILETIDNPKLSAIKMIDCVTGLDEETVEGMQGADNSHHHEHEEGETDEYDEHVWTSPVNAAIITGAIAEAMAEADEKNSDFYKENAKEYIAELNAVDAEFREITESAENKMIIFGDRFPFRYFANEYGLEYRAAFPGCSAESEPSAKTVAYLIDKIKEDNISHVFYIEFSNQKIAKAIQEETGALPIQFHSCHNLSRDEMEQGMSYLSLMRKNAKNLKEALS